MKRRGRMRDGAVWLGSAVYLLMVGCVTLTEAGGADAARPTDGAGLLDAGALADGSDAAGAGGTAFDDIAAAEEVAGLEDAATVEDTAGSGADETGADETDAATGWTMPFDPTVCGAAPHTWLPPSEMGGLVSVEEMALTNLPPSLVDGMLKEAGYEAFGPAKYAVRNFRIRYVTQDRGVLTEATATVGVPVGDDVLWPAPILDWLHGTTGVMDDCAPSKEPLLSVVPGTLWASQGFVTVAPDYLGMLGMGEPSPKGTIHSYMVGEPTAIASLDAVRALLTLLDEQPELGSADAGQVVLLGGSQGGHAVFMTERYAPYYAPELGLIAAVALVPPADVLGQGGAAMSALVSGTGNIMLALIAMKNWYGVPADLDGLLTDQEPYFLASGVEAALSGSCSPDVDPSGLTEVDDLFLPAIVAAATAGDWDSIPPWGCFLRENSLPGTSVPRISDTPILTTFGENDTLVQTAIERENWPKLCAEGYRMEYVECAGLGHTQSATASLAYARVWIMDRLAGVTWDPSRICTITPPVDCSALVQ